MITGPLAFTKLQLMNKPTMDKKDDTEHLMEKECYHKKIGHDLRNCTRVITSLLLKTMVMSNSHNKKKFFSAFN